MKRQRGRGRKSGHQNNSNRSFESNGPDVKIRGNAQHICEKYLQLARDASSSGDRVMAENYYQHAEHYLRIVQANQPRREDGDSDSERQQDRSGGQQARRQDPSETEQPRTERSEGESRPNRSNGHDAASGAEGDAGDEGGRQRRQRTRRRRPEGDAEAGGSDPLAVVDPEASSTPREEASGEAADEQPAPKRTRTRRPRADAAAEDALKAADAKAGAA
ncbi:DUF4167 domain-containing protein [Alkalicaulis satelles]|uniref:DUF4167 domain-containing protein n=1 Tax=Alkalicaulis satelles TaxID=2609175 RepID=A0A5M6ZHF1_9PROT|nr:DUF4167 domain-containing protein [Alkalicaulis satelles]KAA5803720.1 DUF4167 domain-containing protein [Alkalicaulis satelles]